MGRKGLQPGEGLMLLPAFAIHTCFMRFPIDAVFLDSELRVLEVRNELRPWRAAAVRGARAVVELPAGEAERQALAPGDRLSLEEGEEPRASGADGTRTPGLMDLPSGQRSAALATAGLLAIAVLIHFGAGPRGWISAVFAGVLAVLAALDLRYGLIPNRIVLPATIVILIAQLAFFGDQALEWIGAGAGAGLLILLPAVLRPGSIGMGDVKLAALLGVGLGADVLSALLYGSLAAGAVAVWILVTDGLEARKRTIPLGPLLAAGGILALLLADSL